ncbi:MAG: phosphotransferase [Pseudomonadota bacterium]|nr:phosphotransferase [Pseudomonadota bacterium]
MNDPRNEQRRRFLATAGWQAAEITPLRPDASFRRYFRLRRGASRAMLMDAPPPREDIRPFVKIARHLSTLGICAPALYAFDPEHGFLLLEDLGDDTFTRLLAQGLDEEALYEMAVDTLLRLHRQPSAAAIDLPSYGAGPLLDEALLFTDWYTPALRGEKTPGSMRESYRGAWLEIIGALPETTPTLVLRDYHVDNLMRTGSKEKPDCAVLDFQDALLGAPAYDLVSLLQDARRDVSRRLEQRMLERYFQSLQLPDRKAFMQWYRVLGVQRHCKVAGIFVRLCVRDGKCGYLAHIPRVIGLLQRGLAHEELGPLKDWVATNLPHLEPVNIYLRERDFE